MENTHQAPPQDNLETPDTVPNGILYLNYGQPLPYPSINLVITDHMRETSSWRVNMMNATCNFRLSQDIALGLVYQQPFLLRNAYNATTLGISLEMYF
jgi:hypothetical protein